VAQPHCIRWGPSPQFLAHVCYGQTAGWIKIPLGRDEDLGPDDIVLDGDPALPPKGHSPPPIFSPCLLWPNGWMDQDGMLLGTEVGLSPGDIVLDGDLAPTKKGHRTPTFRPMSIVTKRLDGSRCHLVRR